MSTFMPHTQATPSVREQVLAFFRTDVQSIKRDNRGATSSRATRRPQNFDKHLHDALRLKCVIALPALESDFSRLAQRYLDSSTSLPPISQSDLAQEYFPTARQLANNTGYKPLVASNERGVEDAYGRNIADHCSVVAATLAYQLPQWSRGCLEWATVEIGRKAIKGIASDQAVADGFLNLVDSDGIKNIHLTDIQRAVFERFQVLAIWEFKNLNFSDSAGILSEIQNGFLDGLFPWETCKDRQQCILEHVKGSTACRMGWDAEHHQCPSYQSLRGSLSSSDNLVEVVIRSASHNSAKRILQQVWAEAVHNDVTFISIQAGNSEILAIRDRKEQTLYISNAYRVDQMGCNYYQIQTGLFIAAIRDAEDRVKRHEQYGDPPSWSFQTGIDESMILRLTDLSDIQIYDQVIALASTRYWLHIMSPSSANRQPFSRLPYRRITCLPRDWFEENTGFIGDLSSQPDTPEHDIAGLDHDTYYTLKMMDFIHPQHCQAFISLPNVVVDSKTFNFPLLVIKTASTVPNILELENEYEFYLTLEKARAGLGERAAFAKIIGFYFEETPSSPSAALVMESQGLSLDKVKKNNKFFKISQVQRERFEAALKCVHDVGYLHGNLTERNLAFKSGEVSIIGFEKARPFLTSTNQDLRGSLQGIPSWCELSMRKEHKTLKHLFLTPPELNAEQIKERKIAARASDASRFASTTNQRARELREEPRRKRPVYAKNAIVMRSQPDRLPSQYVTEPETWGVVRDKVEQ